MTNEQTLPIPNATDALTFDECEIAGVDGTGREIGQSWTWTNHHDRDIAHMGADEIIVSSAGYRLATITLAHNGETLATLTVHAIDEEEITSVLTYCQPDELDWHQWAPEFLRTDAAEQYGITL